MLLTLTEAASRKVSEVIAQQDEPVAGLRVHAQQGGCSGCSYGMSLATSVEPGDWVGEFGGVKVLVDPESARMLAGVRIDFVDGPQGSGFAIENPNAIPSCSCGGPAGAGGSAGGCGDSGDTWV